MLKRVDEFNDTFSQTPGLTSIVHHHIQTASTTPIRLPSYRVPVALQEAVRDELRAMLSLDIIEPSTSPWAFLLVTVKNKDGKIRPCGDYRRLNDIKQEDPYCMP